jgi:hypothetical protein
VTEDDICKKRANRAIEWGGVMERENAMNNRMEIFDVIDDFYVGSETKVYRTLVLKAREEVNMKNSNTKQ